MEGNENGNKVNDSKRRAEAMSNMLTPNHTTVRLMDGHGRIFFLFCLAVIAQYGEARLNSLRIELYDIDEKVNDYHSSLFTGDACKNVVSFMGTSFRNSQLLKFFYISISVVLEEKGERPHSLHFFAASILKFLLLFRGLRLMVLVNKL
uniref:Uncharacterized protein n=1 Tax=Vannella robusta TaxID=1487602 RepID=A0A7S4M6Q1_9EUKA